MSKKIKFVVILISVLILLIGAALMSYPPFSAWYTELHNSKVHAHYQEIINTADISETESVRTIARIYNQDLFSGKINPLTPDNNGYWEQINVAGNGIMGYIRIPKINVELPIYHGSGNDVLNKGAGHMVQSSLPIGGENTHTVITAHSGMATNPMFSDLELLQIGDIFQIEVLGEILTYEVDQILTVLPYEINALQIKQGHDLATLVTCVPYGVNTHRLLVRGYRIPSPNFDEGTPSGAAERGTREESVWMAEYWYSIKTGLYVAAGPFLLVLIVLLFSRRKKKGAEICREG